MSDRWYWLSFAGDKKHLGCAVIYASDPIDAMRAAWERGINPGGEVAFQELSDEMVMEQLGEERVNVLMSRVTATWMAKRIDTATLLPKKIRQREQDRRLKAIVRAKKRSERQRAIGIDLPPHVVRCKVCGDLSVGRESPYNFQLRKKIPVRYPREHGDCIGQEREGEIIPIEDPSLMMYLTKDKATTSGQFRTE